MVNSLLRLEDLSPEERAGVSELKQRMLGHMEKEFYDDLCMFVRFLRARDLNVNAAEAMLRNHLDWRKILQVDSILTNFKANEVLMKYVTLDILGTDKEGSPVFYFNLGKIDAKGLLKSFRKMDVMKVIIQMLEEAIQMMKRESIKRGNHIDKWIMIINFDALSLAVATHKSTLEMVGNLIIMYEANYPERLKAAYFINTSIYFSMAFAVVKHFLSVRTYRKIKIFGPDNWKEPLLKVIDANTLPVFLGGSRTDPDGNPQCKTFITLGGQVPEEYYIKRKKSLLADQNGVEKLIVTRMSKTKVGLDVPEVGSYLEWEFETKSRDIGFALFYKQDKNDKVLKELIPKQRIDTYMGSETGLYKCKYPGTYIIEFDNSYSWIFQKEIYYKISVVKKDQKN